jgi:hypothetical protein
VRTEYHCPWLTIPQAARLLGVSSAAVWVWVGKGLKGPDGERVKLRTKRIGARRKTRRRWLADFQARLDGTPGAGNGRPARGRPSAALEEQRRLAERLRRPVK